jgi:hypothetical protein
MDDLSTGFRALPDTELPAHLHNATMRRVIFLRYQSLFLRFGVVLALNVALAVWSMWSKVEADTVDVIRTAISDIQMSYLSFADGAQMIRDVVPVHAVVSVIFNLASIGYLLFIFRAERWRMTKVEHSDI